MNMGPDNTIALSFPNEWPSGGGGGRNRNGSRTGYSIKTGGFYPRTNETDKTPLCSANGDSLNKAYG